jgi:hypothetical protein
MATREPSHGEHGAGDSAVHFDGLRSVFGARGMKTTGRRKQRRNPAPITDDESQ